MSLHTVYCCTFAKSDLELTVSDQNNYGFFAQENKITNNLSYDNVKENNTRERRKSESKTETDITHIAEKNKELVSLRKKTMGSRVYYCNQKRDGWQKEKRYQNTFVIWRKGTMLVNT